MSESNRKTPGSAVSSTEVNYLITQTRDLRATHESLKRHLNLIDDRLRNLEETVEALDVDDVVVQDEEAEG